MTPQEFQQATSLSLQHYPPGLYLAQPQEVGYPQPQGVPSHQVAPCNRQTPGPRAPTPGPRVCLAAHLQGDLVVWSHPLSLVGPVGQVDQVGQVGRVGLGVGPWYLPQPLVATPQAQGQPPEALGDPQPSPQV
jgi:hypothetical protein